MRYSGAVCFTLYLSAAAIMEVKTSFQRFQQLFNNASGETIEHAHATRFLIAEQCLDTCVRYHSCDTVAFNNKTKMCILYAASKLTSEPVTKDWEIFKKVNHAHALLII